MNDVQWLNDDDERAWRTVLRMHRRLVAQLHRQLQADSGLSLADYEVLVHLTDQPQGRMRPYELQDALDWEQSRLSHHLGRMHQRGLVTRQECPEDGRGTYVTITDQGRRAIEDAAPGHVRHVRRHFFDLLTPEQVRTLEQLSARILSGLETAPAA